MSRAQLPDPVKSAIRNFNAALARSNLHISSLVLEHASSTSPAKEEDDPLLLVLGSNDAERAKNSLRASTASTDSPSLTTSLPTPLRLPSTLLHSHPSGAANLPHPPGTGTNLPGTGNLPRQLQLQPPQTQLPNPSSLLGPLPLPPPTALKRSSFGSNSSHSSIPFKRSRSNPDTSSIPRQRPLSMPALRSPAPFWGTVLTPPSLPPPAANTNPNPRDDPRFLPLLQDTLSKKLASNTNIPSIPSNTTQTKLQPSPLVSHIRSHPVAAGAGAGSTGNVTPYQSSASTPYVSYRAPPGGSVGVGRPRTSLPRLELGSIPIRSSGASGVGGIGLSSSTGNTGPGGLLPRIEYVSSGNQSTTSSVASAGIQTAGGNTSASGAAGAFSCPHCEAAFKRRSDMNRHVRVVHEKQRPFQCPTCMQRFGEKGNMQKHIRMVHQNIRGFHCQHCGAAFGQRGNCESHIRSVHEKRPGKYECSLCNNRAFARKAHLLDHFASDHPGIPPPSARARPRAPIPPSYPPTTFLPPPQNINTPQQNVNTTTLPPPPTMFGSARSNQPQQQTQQQLPPPLSIPISIPPATGDNNGRTQSWRHAGAGGSSAGDAAVRRKRDEPDAGR